jgi:hypothetical protein
LTIGTGYKTVVASAIKQKTADRETGLPKNAFKIKRCHALQEACFFDFQLFIRHCFRKTVEKGTDDMVSKYKF